MGVDGRIWGFYQRCGAADVTAGVVDVGRLQRVAPNIDFYVMRPTLATPQLCKLCELQDGTYNINDLADMHEALNFMIEVKRDADNR